MPPRQESIAPSNSWNAWERAHESAGDRRRQAGSRALHQAPARIPGPAAGRSCARRGCPCILSSLGFVRRAAAGGWQVDVPSWRVDATRAADLIEEVGRHWGVNRVPARFPSLHTPPHASDRASCALCRIRRILCGAGLQEAVTFTFMDRRRGTLRDRCGVARDNRQPAVREVRRVAAIDVAWPFWMRSSTTGVATLPTCGCSRPDPCSTPPENSSEWAGSSPARDSHTGASLRPRWISMTRLAWATCSQKPSRRRGVGHKPTAPWFMPGRAAALIADDRRIGVVGQLRPDVASSRGLPAGIVVVGGELDLGAFRAQLPRAAGHRPAASACRGSRPVDPHRRWLACRVGSWHDSS